MSDDSTIIDYTNPTVSDQIIIIVSDSIIEPVIILFENIPDTCSTGSTGPTGENIPDTGSTGSTGENESRFISNTSLSQFDILIKKTFKILSFDTNIILTSPNSALFSVIFMCNYGISIMKHISISGIYHSNWIKNNNSIYKYIEDNISNILNS